MFSAIFGRGLSSTGCGSVRRASVKSGRLIELCQGQRFILSRMKVGSVISAAVLFKNRD